MTPTFKPANPRPPDCLFRPANHILVMPEGSTLAILDLDRGVVYTTTPSGAESWNALVNGKRPAGEQTSKEQGGNENRHPWAGVADYLLDRRIIEPVE